MTASEHPERAQMSSTDDSTHTEARLLPGHWIVSLSQGHSNRGALVFAAWLARQIAEEARPDFTLVEVLDEAMLMDRLRFEDRDELLEQHRRRSAALLDELGVADVLGPPHVSVGWKVEDALERRLAAFVDGGLLLGRQAGTEGLRLVKLGELARHMVRQPPAPVLVVPPDLRADAIGPGPVLALADGPQDADRTCRAALEMGRALGRKAQLVRLEDPQTPARSQDAAGSSPGCEIVSAPDSSVDTLLQVADRAEAVVLVTVSHQLSLAERILEGDLGSRLAAKAARPVIVLPPEPHNQDR